MALRWLPGLAIQTSLPTTGGVTFSFFGGQSSFAIHWPLTDFQNPVTPLPVGEDGSFFLYSFAKKIEKTRGKSAPLASVNFPYFGAYPFIVSCSEKGGGKRISCPTSTQVGVRC